MCVIEVLHPASMEIYIPCGSREECVPPIPPLTFSAHLKKICLLLTVRHCLFLICIFLITVFAFLFPPALGGYCLVTNVNFGPYSYLESSSSEREISYRLSYCCFFLILGC